MARGSAIIADCFAAVAQLVERNLAKVEVESSRLFCRSRFRGENARLILANSHFPFSISAEPVFGEAHPAGWQSGYAAACKAVYAGSIPTPASNDGALPAFSSAVGLTPAVRGA